MEYLFELLDKNASAIFGVSGTIIGFFGNYILQKLSRKHEIIKEEAKEYFKEKRNLITKSIRLISDYEYRIKTLHDLIEDENGIPIAELKKEDVFEEYFLLIFEYLHANRFYLEKETILKLDKLVEIYHLYKLNKKVIIAELDGKDIALEISKLKLKLFEDAQVLFNTLKEQITFNEITNYKKMIGQN